MGSLQDQIGRRFRPGRISVNAGRFFRPGYSFGTNVHSDTTDTAESLRFREKMLVPPQGFFHAFGSLDVGYDAIPFDDVSRCISKRDAAVQMPSITPIGTAKTNLAFMRLAA